MIPQNSQIPSFLKYQSLLKWFPCCNKSSLFVVNNIKNNVGHYYFYSAVRSWISDYGAVINLRLNRTQFVTMSRYVCGFHLALFIKHHQTVLHKPFIGWLVPTNIYYSSRMIQVHESFGWPRLIKIISERKTLPELSQAFKQQHS